MKKIFYKIFLTFLICSYVPLMGIFIFQYWYTTSYMEKLKTKDLVNQLNHVKIEDLKKENIYDSRNHTYISYLNVGNPSKKSLYFKLFNKLENNKAISNIGIGNVKVVKLRLSSISNHIYAVKRISNDEAVTGVVEVIKPDIVLDLILKFYKGYSFFAIPIIFLLTYILSKRFSNPIETLETISNNMVNQDFTKSIQIESKTELNTLAQNMNKMGESLKQKISQLNAVNEKLKQELIEKQKLLDEKQKLLDEKQKLLDGKITFMRAISHELKTPVAIINGYIEALQDGLIPNEDIEKTYNLIYNEGLSMDKLVKNINSYLKSTDYAAVELVEEKLDVKSIIEQDIDRYRLDIRQKEINLKCDIEKTEVVIDKKCLKTILNNLLTNALTYVDERKIIEITLKNGVLQVANSCETISDETLEKIFNPFFKGDFSRQRKYGGTGLGLSIVKNLLDFLKLQYSFTFDKDRKFAVFTVKFK